MQRYEEKVQGTGYAASFAQWGRRRGYRELRNRGVSRDLAWNTAKSAHGPWRLSRSPGLAFALPASYFVSLGVPILYVKRSSQPNRRGT